MFAHQGFARNGYLSGAVTPYAAAQAINYRMPSYLEQGNGTADSFALSYAGRDVTATRSELGLRLDRTTVMDDTLLALRGRAAWAHNFETARNTTATFQALLPRRQGRTLLGRDRR